MAQQLYFSRDTRMFIQFRNPADNTETAAKLGAGKIWEVPVLDGYSFSQTTNTSEITLAEMESTAGISRRGRRMFTDSLAPAEWSFSTYIRPFKSKAGSVTPAGSVAASDAAEVHAVEEAFFASMFGADTYTTGSGFTRATNAAASGGGVSGGVITPGANSSIITIGESNRSALTSFTLYFMIDTATDNPLVYRMPEAIVNEVSVDFDVDGIATLNWSGFSKEIQDVSGGVVTGTSAPAYNATTNDGSTVVLGDVFIDTDNAAGRQFNLISTVPGSGNVSLTAAIDEAATSTKNFIRNRLTSVSVEAATATDKVPTIFPGKQAAISAIDVSGGTDKVTTSTAHGFATGDEVQISGITGSGGTTVDLNGTHFVNVTSTTQFKLYNTAANATTGSATGLTDLDALSAGTLTNAVVCNGKYSLTLTGGNFTIGNNITYLVPEELGAINKPLEHVTGTRTATGTATCYLTLEDSDLTSGTSRQFFNDLVGTGAMSKVVNKFKVTMDVGGSTAATSGSNDPALKIEFPTAHITVPTHQIEDVISLETNFEALPTDFGTADEITSLTYFPVGDYA
ncbi:MAG: hypothetical protein CBB96_07710 [Gammaproteobacteria bacterium TMED36]|nr:MAG: hypothetical protein CBB96_07710 [Gammaproteobacteria bacterium TMED36]